MNKPKEMVLVALLSAILVISKEILAFLPNIELVSFLIIIFSRHFKLKNTFMIVNVFCLLQIVLYGIGDWTIMYFIMWNGLAFVSMKLKDKLKKADQLAVLSGIFGLTFGAFFAIFYLLFSFETAFSFWIKGLFFDLIHGVGNYLIMIVLFEAVDHWIEKFFYEL